MATGIQYIRDDIPEVEIPAYRGQRYGDLVPDTLDIAERVELAVNGVSATTDPDADHEIYFWINFFHEPPVMSHKWDDWCQPKFMEALPLLRAACGSSLNDDVDESWKLMLLKSIGPDGLFYFPMKGGCWFGHQMSDHPLFLPGGAAMSPLDESATHYASPFACGRLISTMGIYLQRDGNAVWREVVEKMVQRLAELAIDRGDHCFYPIGFFTPHAELPAGLDATPELSMTDMGGGRLPEALAKYARDTGFEPALDLAGGLANAIRYHSLMFDEDGAFINRRQYTREGQAAPTQELMAASQAAKGETVHGGHFHSHTICLLNLLEYGLVSGDRDLLDFCRRSYEWARVQGSTLTGFFPTVLNPQFFHSGLPYSDIRSPWYDEFEICELADMIAIALKLSAGGVGDYYDDVDRWTRNFFAEGQLTQIDWIETRPRYMDTRPLFASETSDRVAERSKGGFAGWMSGSEWATRMGIMHCCTGNATRSLYYLWEHMLTEGEAGVQVNLRMNRAGRLVDVHGHEPYEGCVEVKVKAPLGSVRVRAPEWVAADSGELQVKVDGEVVPASWSGRYVEVRGVGAGSVVSAHYPQERYMVKEQLGDGIFTLTMKGSTVVAVDPPGRICPIFQRAHYREDSVRWRRVERFVPDAPVDW